MLSSHIPAHSFAGRMNRFPPASCTPGRPLPLLPQVTCPEELFEKALNDAFSGLAETVPILPDHNFTDTSLAGPCLVNPSHINPSHTD